MTPQPVTTPPDTAVGEVWRIMNERRFRHMLVADDSGRLLGIVTQRDLLVAARASERKIDFGSFFQFTRSPERARPMLSRLFFLPK